MTGQQNHTPLAKEFWTWLEVDTRYIGSPIQMVVCQFLDSWDQGRIDEARKLCSVAFGLLEKERDLIGFGANLSYTEGVLNAFRGGIHLLQGTLDSAEVFLRKSADCFGNATWGRYNASVVRMILARVLASQAKCEEALEIYQHSIRELELSLSHPKRQELRRHIDVNIGQVLHRLCKSPDGGTTTVSSTGHQSGGPASVSSQVHRPKQSLSLILRFMPVLEDAIPAGKAKSLTDSTETYVSIGSVEIDDQLYSLRQIEPGQGQHVQLALGVSHDYVVVRVYGDSMKDLDIEEGDYVLLRQPRGGGAFIPESGRVVAAIILDEDWDEERTATLKRFIRRDSKLILQPENPNRRSVEFTNSANVEIIGEAIALLRKVEESDAAEVP